MYKISLFIVAVIFSFYTNADFTNNTATITINGSVKAKPCDIELSEKNIDLGTFYSPKFASSNSTSDWVSFSINLLNCPDTTTTVKSTFTGTVSTGGNYKNVGTAQNISVQLSKNDNTLLPNNSIVYTTVADDGKAILNLKTRLISESGGATGGNVLAAITVNYEWQ